MWCSVLLYVAVCCSVMQCVAVLHESRGAPGKAEMDQRRASGLKGKASHCPVVEASEEHTRTHTPVVRSLGGHNMHHSYANTFRVMASWGLKHNAVELLSRVEAGHLVLGAKVTALIAWHSLLLQDSFYQRKLLRCECTPTIFALSFVEGS